MFYISSLGSSANTWIGKMLSMHPKIVCFGSSRSFPPVWPGFTYPFKNHQHDWIKEISAEKYIQSLLLCNKSVHGEKIFGSIHGYHGLLAKEPCERLNGIFSYIARNPISRVHSVFIHSCVGGYYLNDNFLKNEKIHERTCEVLKNHNLVKIAKDKDNSSNNFKISNLIKNVSKSFIPNKYHSIIKEKISDFRIKRNSKVKIFQKEEDFLISTFISCVREFLKTDNILFKNCEKTSGIKMEEFVKSPNYFKEILLTRVSSELNINDDYLKQVFNSKKINNHRDQPLDEKTIWNDWPESMKNLYNYYFEKNDLNEFCKHFDYKIF